MRASTLRRLRGNALWTYSALGAPRQENGRFLENRLDAIGRDAMLVWNATGMRVEQNAGGRIGYPAEAVDPLAQPVAIGSLGDVDHSTLARNQFDEIDGKCIELDGFHHGSVIENRCVNRRPPAEYPYGHFGIVMNNTQKQPAEIEIARNEIDGTRYGGLFLIGSGHRVSRNKFEHLNSAGCREAGQNGGCVYLDEEPKMLESGIYLGRAGANPAATRGNTIQDNVISGFKMNTRCIAAAPGVLLQSNTLGGNQCIDYQLTR